VKTSCRPARELETGRNSSNSLTESEEECSPCQQSQWSAGTIILRKQSPNQPVLLVPEDEPADMTCEMEKPLIRAAQAGDLAAFDTLYLNTRETMLRWARRMAPSQDAEDLIHDSYTLALRSITRFRGDCRFASWLYRILVNEVAEQRRRMQHHTYAELIDEPVDSHYGLPDRQIGIADLLHNLQSRDRRMLVRRVQGYSGREIAAQFNISPTAVRVRLHRSREVIRSAMKAAPQRVAKQY
jgi:RNA polymerase sigma-70 factor (ECF subfamily)